MKVSEPTIHEISEEASDINFDSNLTLDTVKKAWKDIMETFKARRQMVLYASLVTGRPIKCKEWDCRNPI